ncbi:MAG TPA: hypothetical protein VFT99_07870, partial [Roseiflexaceae bacterium]|nr:hypothetical protein [Roseiflexaceae bacterium]
MQASAGRKLLLQLGATRKQILPMDKHAVGIAGHKHDPHTRVNRAHSFGQATALHFRHDHIGHQQIDRQAAMVDQAQRLFALAFIQGQRYRKGASFTFAAGNFNHS